MTRALILIDIQTGFDDPMWGARNNPDAEAKAGQLLAHARAQGWGIFHVQHISLEDGSPLKGAGTAFKPEVTPQDGEQIVQKSVNSGFIGTDLKDQLDAGGFRALTICGLTTPHCVSTTSRMAANFGYDVTLAHDACASFVRNVDTSWNGAEVPSPQAIHDMALHHINGEFVRVRAVADILADG